jgi:hypothetical protein
MGGGDLGHQPAHQRRDADVTPNRVAAMHPMLSAVIARRMSPPGADRTANRWRAWAQQRNAGRVRRVRALRTAGVVFLRAWRSPGAGPGSPRPGYSATTRLRLAVNAVLVSRLGGHSRNGRRPPADPAVFAHRWHPSPIIGRPPHDRRRDRRPVALRHRTSAAGARAAGTGDRVAPIAPPWSVRAVDRGSTFALQPVVRREVTELVTRLVHSHRRVELLPRGAGAARNRLPVATQVDRVPAGNRPWAQEPRPAPASAGPPLTAPAPVDVERLTDQIVARLDDRLTAHRERFGRAY